MLNPATETEIESRLREENPWWLAGVGIDSEQDAMPRRDYLPALLALIQPEEPQQPVLLMGQRRVGKSTLVSHAIHALLQAGVAGRDILYLPLETPSLTGSSLDTLVRRFGKMFERPAGTRMYIFLDEIQYQQGWELQLKALADSYRHCRFVAVASAAAALKQKSVESAAGQFSEFLLPPLTFCEFLHFIDKETTLIREESEGPGPRRFVTTDINALNEAFVDYLNYGGYPEAVHQGGLRMNPRRFVRSDIIDQVLLRDLPSLYGIADVQELNALFNTLAYNTAQELSIEELAKSSGVSKPTVVKYLEYLEAAFLIKRLRRVDQNAQQFVRAMTFKVYLTNPTMRAALFTPLADNDPAFEQLVETALFSQWLHNSARIDSLCYARGKRAEVSLVSLDARQQPRFAVAVKWSDQVFEDAKEIKSVIEFARANTMGRKPLVTTRSQTGIKTMQGIEIEFTPASLLCYTVSKNMLDSR